MNSPSTCVNSLNLISICVNINHLYGLTESMCELGIWLNLAIFYVTLLNILRICEI